MPFPLLFRAAKTRLQLPRLVCVALRPGFRGLVRPCCLEIWPEGFRVYLAFVVSRAGFSLL